VILNFEFGIWNLVGRVSSWSEAIGSAFESPRFQANPATVLQGSIASARSLAPE